MKKTIFLLLFTLTSCTSSCTDKAGYDGTIYEHAEKAAQGDFVAAHEAAQHCQAILKLGGTDSFGIFTGLCGGFDALILENAFMSGDPYQIYAAFDAVDNYIFKAGESPSDATTTFQKYPKRAEFYMDIAQYRIKKRCAEPKPPASCQDKELLKKFGL
jgi:hypothetical protein